MLHKAFVITEIALRYYNITHPERNYTRHYAVKQWRQDRKIKKNVLSKVVKQIFSEQKDLLK
jgi:hypothetical protein